VLHEHVSAFRKKNMPKNRNTFGVVLFLGWFGSLKMGTESAMGKYRFGNFGWLDIGIP